MCPLSCPVCGRLTCRGQCVTEAMERAREGAERIVENAVAAAESGANADADVARLRGEKLALQAYLRVKLDAEDYHAVADAAMDLREIDAKLSVLEGR